MGRLSGAPCHSASCYHSHMSNDPKPTDDQDDGEFVYTPRASAQDVTRAIRRQQTALRATLPDVIQNLPDVQPTDEETESFLALMACVNLEKGDLAGVELADGLRARAGCVIALLGGLAAGGFWDECAKRSGISYISARALGRWDKDGFGVMLKAAMDAQTHAHTQKMRKSLVKRAVEGVKNYKIGRIGKDKDGILKDDDGNPVVERKYSDSLLEFGLTKLDKATFGEVAQTQNVGQQVIYNISGLSFVQNRQPDAAECAKHVTEVPKAGDNPATIDLRSLEDLD